MGPCCGLAPIVLVVGTTKRLPERLPGVLALCTTWDFSGFSLSNLFVFIFFFLFDSSSSSCLAHGLHVLQKVSSLTFCSTSTHSDREWNLGSFESVRDSPTSSLYPALPLPTPNGGPPPQQTPPFARLEMPNFPRSVPYETFSVAKRPSFHHESFLRLHASPHLDLQKLT